MFLAILALVLSVNVVFADDVNETGLDVYVSNDGSDSFGNGTIDNPYQTLNFTIEKASNNSNIYLKNGTYTSTGYEIKNKSISITGVGEVTLDGLNGNQSQVMFKVTNESSLVLNNIKFVNGYASKSGDLSPIINEGNLNISNCIFYNFTTINGVIFNKNSLTLDNISESKLNINWDEIYGTAGNGGFSSWILEQIENNPSRGEFITNIGDCVIFNSKFISTVYNNRNMDVINSYLETFISNRSYDMDINSIIDKSKIMSLKVSQNSLLILNNSFVDPKNNILYYSNAVIQNTTFFNDSDENYYSFRASYSNVSIKSSSFNRNIYFEYSNVNITHSAILGSLSTWYDCYINANYNWWGFNRGPNVYENKYSKVIRDYWIVMTLEFGDDTVSVDLNKFTDNNNVWNLEDSNVNSRFVTLESESGKFSQTQGDLVNGSFKAKLLDNNVNTMVYATIDNQVLRIAIGDGLTSYTWYVSDTLGNDYFCDGSYEYPYKTLKKAVSEAFSGNTIYVMEGVYTLSWNANLKISKELNFVGLGNAVLSRPNNRNIFIVDDKGILNIDNINFTTYTQDYYYNPLIYMNGGIVNVKNSNFYNVSHTYGAIFTVASQSVSLDNVTFDNVGGAAVRGNSLYVLVNNSRFTSFLQSTYTSYGGYELSNADFDDYSYMITVRSDVDVLNSIFENNEIGFVAVNQRGTYLISNAKTYVYNSTFKNNNLVHTPVGLDIGVRSEKLRYSVVDSCSFYNTRGHVVMCNIIDNCTFINNTDVSYDERFQNSIPSSSYPEGLIEASDLINNSYFKANSLPSKSYEQPAIHCPYVYNSAFIENSAAYGGALFEPREVHYCVFVNNTGIYGADDIFVYKGDLNASGNWWGSNQKPDTSRVQVFIGNLILDNWVVMNLTQENDLIIASLNTILNDNKTFTAFDHVLPSRYVAFTADKGEIVPYSIGLVNNYAYATLVKNTTDDFDVYAVIDNQILSLTVYNNSTLILMDDVTFYGNDNRYKITLINVNGHKISSQLLEVIVTSANGEMKPYTLTTDDLGITYLNVDYSIGIYDIEVNYYGNGYFDKSSARAIINISSISTSIYSHNYTYWGKNNIFYGILTDGNGKHLMNQTLILSVYNSNDKLISQTEVMTATGGRADALLSLDVGSYKIVWQYPGNEWYDKSSSLSLVEIKPINTTLTLPNETFYGKGNDYEFTFTDIYGNRISDETVMLKISNASDSNEFAITVENGVGTININLLPGAYSLEATYLGDEIYGSANAKATLNIERVFLTFDFKSYAKILENGVFTSILKDMYGKRVQGQDVSLELYDDGLYRTYFTTSDANGEANFKIDAGENIYFAIINFNGNTWYRPATGAATIDVNHNVGIGRVYLNASDYAAYYGENKYFTIFFNDTNKFSLEGMKIPVIISSGDFSRAYDVESDPFGNVRLQITLEPGTYDITYKYENAYYNIFDSKTNKITIYKMPTSLVASDMIVKKGDTRNFEVKLINKNGAAISNVAVKIRIDNASYDINTNSFGVAKLPLNLDLGYHNVECLFENANYISSAINVTVLVVNDSKTITSIESSEVYSGEGTSFNYTVILEDALSNPIRSSQIILNLTDGEGNFINTMDVYTNSLGEAAFSLNLTYGTYLAKTYYWGNDKYFESFNTNRIYISPLENVTETILFGNDCEIINGYDNKYFAVLKTVDGDYIANATVEFIVKGHSYYSTTDETGNAYLEALFNPGAYEVKARFNGSNNLTKAYITNYIQVSGELLYFITQDVVKSFNNNTHYYVGLFDALGNPLVGKTVNFKFANETFSDTTDSDGFACFEVWLNPGSYVIEAAYQGTYPDEYGHAVNNITVLTTIIGEDKINYGNTDFSVLFLDNMGNPLSNTEVYFVVNEIIYKIKTDINGIGLFNVNLEAGNYKVIVINSLSGENKTFSLKIVSTISSSILVKYYKSSSKFKATFLDKNGAPLKNTKIKFTINGKTYNVKTNSKGVATLKINFKPGKYKITILNTKTNEKKTNTVTIKTIIKTKNKKVKKGKKINFQAKILKTNGKVAKKVTVKFKINKKIYKVKTNRKGIAKLNIKLKKGKYTIITTYNGLSVKNKVRVVK